jgi:hypothetical protein
MSALSWQALRELLASELLLVRFLKLSAVMVFVAGALGSVLVVDGRAREVLGLRAAPAGFLGVWAVGALYAWALSHSLVSAWILLASLLSFGVVTAVVALAMRPASPPRTAPLFIATLLGVCVALMVWKP